VKIDGSSSKKVVSEWDLIPQKNHNPQVRGAPRGCSSRILPQVLEEGASEVLGISGVARAEFIAKE
jgi:hypothetical protein